MRYSIFRRSGNRFGEKNMLKKFILRELLSIGRFRPIGKRANSDVCVKRSTKRSSSSSDRLSG
jgi:hypothetical protein